MIGLVNFTCIYPIKSVCTILFYLKSKILHMNVLNRPIIFVIHIHNLNICIRLDHRKSKQLSYKGSTVPFGLLFHYFLNLKLIMFVVTRATKKIVMAD